MAPDVESGFEALLKPLQDITSKVWDIVLTKVTICVIYIMIIHSHN